MQSIVVSTEAQLAQCLDVRREVFIEEQGVPVELENDDYDKGPSACTHVLIVDKQGAAVATGRWIWYKERTAKLQRIAVLETHRGQGVGREVIEALEREARRAGAEAIVLDSQCHAEAFYAKLGYKTISDEPFDDAGIPHVRMEKRL